MSAQINSFNAVSFVAGFAACGLLAAAVMASPQRGTTAQMAAVAPVAQVAKFSRVPVKALHRFVAPATKPWVRAPLRPN